MESSCDCKTVELREGAADGAVKEESTASVMEVDEMGGWLREVVLISTAAGPLECATKERKIYMKRQFNDA